MRVLSPDEVRRMQEDALRRWGPGLLPRDAEECAEVLAGDPLDNTARGLASRAAAGGMTWPKTAAILDVYQERGTADAVDALLAATPEPAP
jgi:hypothetical protein